MNIIKDNTSTILTAIGSFIIVFVFLFLTYPTIGYRTYNQLTVNDNFAFPGGTISANFYICKTKDVNLAAKLSLWQEKGLEREFAPVSVSDVNKCISKKQVTVIRWDIPCEFKSGDYKASLTLISRDLTWHNKEKTIFAEHQITVRPDFSRCISSE